MKIKILLICCFLVFGLINSACSTTSRMVDQTYLNADKNVWSYEEFYKQNSAYEQFKIMVSDLQVELDTENSKGDKKDTELVKQLNVRIAGAKDMKRNIASKYNAMSSIHYQTIWKNKNLPERLGEN